MPSPSSSLMSLLAVSVSPTLASPVMVTLPVGVWLNGLTGGTFASALPISAVGALEKASSCPWSSLYSTCTVSVLPLSPGWMV